MIEQVTADTMVYVNSVLVSICAVLLGVVAWYFRQDMKQTRQMYNGHDEAINELREANLKTNQNIELSLLELRSNKEMDNRRMDMMTNMMKILAKKTKTDIGL
jgi:hypothetical protein